MNCHHHQQHRIEYSHAHKTQFMEILTNVKHHPRQIYWVPNTVYIYNTCTIHPYIKYNQYNFNYSAWILCKLIGHLYRLYRLPQCHTISVREIFPLAAKETPSEVANKNHKNEMHEISKWIHFERVYKFNFKCLMIFQFGIYNGYVFWYTKPPQMFEFSPSHLLL